MKNKIVILQSKINLLDWYIIQALIPKFIFWIIICSIFSEIVGISFEQVDFLLEQQLSITVIILIHWLKLPSFISLSLPFALLIATINVYTKLSNKSEIIAMQSIGISVKRLIAAPLTIAFITTIAVFVFHELIVPHANYQAAITLEQEWNLDRSKLSKYNKKEIIYQEFENNEKSKALKLLFFANQFDGRKMKEITLLKYKNKQISKIVIANSAEWNQQKGQWIFFSGNFYVLNNRGAYIQSNSYQQLSVKLTRNILDYVNHYRDNREMNIVDLYRRLAIVKHTGNTKQIRSLQISIQERYAKSLSCLIFAFLGSVLGINSKNQAKHNSLGIALIIILTYYSAQFLSTALAASKVISIFWGVWFPNFWGLIVGCFMLQRTQ